MNEYYEIIEVISEIQSMMSHGVEGVMAIIFAIAAVVGLLQCFFGYKLMKLCFAVVGFVLGGIAGFLFTGFTADEAAVVIAAALICGILGALLLFHVYRIGVFVTNTALITLLMIIVTGVESTSGLVASIVIGIVAGIIGVIFVRVWTIISTGAAGGISAGSCLGAIFGSGALGVIIGLALTVLGIVFQFRTTGKKKNQAKCTQTYVYTEVPVYTAPQSTAAPQNTAVPRSHTAPRACAEPKVQAAPKVHAAPKTRPAAKAAHTARAAAAGSHLKNAQRGEKISAFANDFAKALKDFAADMKKVAALAAGYVAAGIYALAAFLGAAFSYGRAWLGRKQG